MKENCGKNEINSLFLDMIDQKKINSNMSINEIFKIFMIRNLIF